MYERLTNSLSGRNPTPHLRADTGLMEQPTAAVVTDLREAQPNGEAFTDHHTSHESSSLRAGSGEPRALGVWGHSELRESQGCIPHLCEDPCLSVEKLI